MGWNIFYGYYISLGKPTDIPSGICECVGLGLGLISLLEFSNKTLTYFFHLFLLGLGLVELQAKIEISV